MNQIHKTNKPPRFPAQKVILPTDIFGYDRLSVWIDNPDIDMRALKPHCAGVEMLLAQMRFNARFKSKISIFQPTTECLVQFQRLLGTETSLLINYVEISRDSLCNDDQQVQRHLDKFLASASLHYERQEVTHVLNTYYFGRRSNGKSRRPRVFTVYGDKPSKLNNTRPSSDNSACFHCELRVSGASSLEAIGIVSLADLISFDHRDFWDSQLRMYTLPNKLNLGKTLASISGSMNRVSDTAFRNRANRWIAENRVNGKFVFQNALIKNHALARRLNHSTFSSWSAEIMSNTSIF